MSETFAVVQANLKGNLGDFAILHAMLADIHATFPGAVIDVYSLPHVPVDQARFAAFARQAPLFRNMGAMEQAVPAMSTRAIRALRAVSLLRVWQDRRIERGARRLDGFGRRFADYDGVFLAGGAQWTGVNAAASMFASLRAIARHNQAIRTYPVSVSSSLRAVNRRAALARDFALIRQPLIARDSETRLTLQQPGLEIALGADCVFSLGPDPDAPVPQNDSRRLLFVLTKQRAEDIAAVALSARRAGFDPALLSTCEIEDGQVQRAAAEHAGIPFIAPLTWQEVVEELNASRLVVTNRLHGLILASFSAAAAIPLTDRQKVRAVAADADLPARAGALSDLDGHRLNAALADEDLIRERLRAYRRQALRSAWSPLRSAG